MSLSRILTVIIALILSALSPSIAQDGDRDRERAVREAERQLREAERQLREAARRLADLQRDAQGRQWKIVDHRYMWAGNRARLGVVLGTEGNEAPEAGGAIIRAVTPGGPADAAGLKAGDVILKFNGNKLAGPASTREDGEDWEEEAVSGPAARLIDLARQLSDGEKVTLEYRRGKDTRTVTLVARALDPARGLFAEDFEPWAMAFGFGHGTTTPPAPPAPPAQPAQPAPTAGSVPPAPPAPEAPPAPYALPHFAPFAVQAPWMHMELVSLNPDLAEYFETDHGILVVRAPRAEGLKLKSGDVILKIGDEEPATPANAVRLLRARDPDQPLTILILRKGEKMTLTADASEIDLPALPGEAPAPRPRRRSNL